MILTETNLEQLNDIFYMAKDKELFVYCTGSIIVIKDANLKVIMKGSITLVYDLLVDY